MFDPSSLNDPLLMALLAAMQGGGSGAGPQQSNPDIFQDPSGVWQNRPAVPNMPFADPLDQALANKPFILEGDYMSQQHYGDLEKKKAMRDLAAMEQQKQVNELRKIEFVKSLDFAASSAKDENKRIADLDLKYLDKIAELDEQTEFAVDAKEKSLLKEQLTNRYLLLRKGTPGSPVAGSPEDMVKSWVDEKRKTMKDEDIIAGLAADIAAAKGDDPRAASAKKALEYIKAGKQAATPTSAPTLVRPDAKAAPVANTKPQPPSPTIGSGPFSVPVPETSLYDTATNAIPYVAPRKPSGPYSIPSPGEQKVRVGKDAIDSALISIADTGGKYVPREKAAQLIASAKKQYDSFPGTGFSFPEFVARAYFGTVDYQKVENLIKLIESVRT